MEYKTVSECVSLLKVGKLHHSTLSRSIRTVNMLPLFLATYWKDGKCPMANQAKIGISNAILKFSEQDYALLDNSSMQYVRQLMLICRPKPVTLEQQKLLKEIATRGRS